MQLSEDRRDAYPTIKIDNSPNSRSGVSPDMKESSNLKVCLVTVAAGFSLRRRNESCQ